MNGKNVQGSRLSWKETLSFSSEKWGQTYVCGDECIFTGLLYKLCANQSGNRRNDHVDLKIFDAVSDVAIGVYRRTVCKTTCKSASVDQTNGSSICGISITFYLRSRNLIV